MSEQATPTLHINWTRTERWRVRILACPTCEHRRRMLCEFQEYYGWRSRCMTCGEGWEDGEMLPRPFIPGWRKDAVKAARVRLAALQARMSERGKI